LKDTLKLSNKTLKKQTGNTDFVFQYINVQKTDPWKLIFNLSYLNVKTEKKHHVCFILKLVYWKKS